MEDRDENVYVISLDALDMNLLPAIYNIQDDRIAPLWAKSNLDRQNNEYYQFEIKCKDSEESVKDESPKLEFQSVKCDICDVNVPKPFLGKHRKSSRHITNVKIADIALHRIKKYIKNTDTENHCTNCDETDPSVYFCTTCITIVDSKEKATHEDSLVHKNSVILEKIFTDFLLLYHSQEKIDDDYAKAETNTKKVDLDAKLSDAVLKFVNSTSNFDDSSNNGSKSIEKQINASKKVKQDVVPINETIVAQTKSPRVSLKDYLTLINSCIKHPMFFKLRKDSSHIIEIETIDGSLVKVTETNFHSFNRVGKNLIQCYTCKEIFKEKFVEEHKMSEKHIGFMIMPLVDKHCARKIDNCLSHCLICNLMTEYSDLHSLCDEDHEENLKEALISDKVEDDQYSHEVLDKNSTTVKDNFTKTKDKDIYQKDNKWIEVMKKVGKLDIENCVKTNEMKVPSVIPNKYFCTSCNEFISTYRRSKHDATKKHVLNSKSKYHYLMREVENQLFCNICNVAIRNNTECVNTHVFEQEHLKKYNQILVDNKIKQNKDIFYCEPCDEVLLIKKELMHVNAKSHREKCFSVEYLVTVSEKIEKEDDKMSIIEFFHCNVCNVKVPNNERNIQEHMDGRSHALNVTKTSTAINDDNDEPIVIKDIHYLMEPTKFPKLLNCKVCNVITLHNETWVSEHIASAKHSMKYNKLLKDNYLVLKADNCYCNICKAFVGFKNEFMHIHGKKHNSNREKLKLSNVSLSKSSSDLSVHSIETPSVSIVKDISNINQPSVSNVKDISNINNPSVSNVKDITNTNTPSVSNVKHEDNINNPSVSIVKDISNINQPSVSNVKDITNTNTPSVSNVKPVDNINNPSVSNVKDICNINNPLASNAKDVSNINTPSVSNVKDISNIRNPSGSNAKDVNNINKPSVSNVEDINNIGTSISKSDFNSLFAEDPNIALEMLVILKSTPKPKEVICKICNVKVPFNELNVSTHLRGNKHKVACKDFLEKIAEMDDFNSFFAEDIELDMQVILKSTPNPKEVICKMCNVKVPFNELNVSTHLRGNKHKVECKDFLKKIAEMDDFNSFFAADIELDMQVILKSTPDPKEVICKICNVKVPFNELNVSTHLRGNKHKVACKAFLEKIAKKEPNLTQLS